MNFNHFNHIHLYKIIPYKSYCTKKYKTLNYIILIEKKLHLMYKTNIKNRAN